jgi:glutathione synthase/RimK-type ligase-like ATP-grasp enzyme
MSNYVSENRALIEAIERAGKEYGIACTILSDEWVVRMEKAGEKRFLYGYAFDCNSQAASAIAFDKVAMYLLLADNKLAAVPHYLLSTVVQPEIDEQYLGKLFAEHGSLVIKPVQGSRGQFVAKVENPKEVMEFVRTTSEVSWAASPFVAVERELRLAVFEGEVLLAYEKHSPTMVNDLMMYNINLGAQARRVDPNQLEEKLHRLAVSAMNAINLKLGAVDIVIDDAGNAQVLEINAAFSLEHYALISPQNRREVIDFYMRVVNKLFGN